MDYDYILFANKTFTFKSLKPPAHFQHLRARCLTIPSHPAGFRVHIALQIALQLCCKVAKLELYN